MADTKAKEPVVKTERKKPVRKAPVQKDYSSKLEWLKAMTEYEEKQAEVSTSTKLARLDKRIAAAKVARDEAVAKLTALITERDKLAGVPVEDTAADSDPVSPEA
jgi:hypothetical protein